MVSGTCGIPVRLIEDVGLSWECIHGFVAPKLYTPGYTRQTQESHSSCNLFESAQKILLTLCQESALLLHEYGSQCNISHAKVSGIARIPEDLGTLAGMKMTHKEQRTHSTDRSRQEDNKQKELLCTLSQKYSTRLTYKL